MILASEAFKKATALEEEKVLQETEEMSQEIPNRNPPNWSEK